MVCVLFDCISHIVNSVRCFLWIFGEFIRCSKHGIIFERSNAILKYAFVLIVFILIYIACCKHFINVLLLHIHSFRVRLFVVF